MKLYDAGIDQIFSSSDPVSNALMVAYIIVSALVVIAAIAALVMWIVVWLKYRRGNKQTLQSGKNSIEMARQILDKAGLYDVQVKPAGFFRALVFGNHYNMGKKTIYLRKNIVNNNTITSVGLALQKVGVAQLCESGDKKAVIRYKSIWLSLFAPMLFIPTVLVGFCIDLFLIGKLTAISIVTLIIGLIIVCSGFVATLLTIPVEKKANEMALKTIDETGIFTNEERNIIKDVFDAYITAYILDFIVAVLRVIQVILKIIISARSSH